MMKTVFVRAHSSANCYKKRRGKQVISEYIGNSETARLIALFETIHRTTIKTIQASERAEFALFEAQDAADEELFNGISQLTRCELLNKGFHQHKGMWRRKHREKTEIKKKVSKSESFASTKPQSSENLSEADFDALAVNTIKEEMPELWRKWGDLLLQARETYIANLNTFPLGNKSVEWHIEEIQKELGYESASRLERLLIDQVVFCWLRLSMVENQYTNILKVSHTVAAGSYWEKRLNGAHKRYQKACESLARVRKLLRPPRSKAQLKVGVVNATLNNVPIGNLVEGGLVK